MARTRLTKIAILLVKLAISLALLRVVYELAGDDSFIALRDQPKNWTLLGLALPLVLGAVLLTFFRWMLLVQALGMHFRLADALRLGFLGYLFNFVSLGSVGGDLFKAVFIAREQHGRRAEAAATVVLDRLVGLYALFLVAAAAVLWSGLYAQPDPRVRTIAAVALWCAAIGAVCIGLLLVPAVTGERMAAWLARLPVVGPTALQLLLALRLYRQRFGVILVAIALSVVVHTVFAFGFYLISQALPAPAPTLAEHFVVVPLSLLAAATPLPMAGLGAFEAALDFLYYYVGADEGVKPGQGMIIALCYRAMTVLVALLGVVYYLRSRRAVREAMEEAEAEEGIEN